MFHKLGENGDAMHAAKVSLQFEAPTRGIHTPYISMGCSQLEGVVILREALGAPWRDFVVGYKCGPWRLKCHF